MTQPPVIMLCAEKDSWFKHSIVLNGLSYGIARLFDSFVPSRSTIEGTTAIQNNSALVLWEQKSSSGQFKCNAWNTGLWTVAPKMS